MSRAGICGNPRKEACFRQRVPVKTDRAKPATEMKRSEIEVAHCRLHYDTQEDFMSKELAKTYDPKGLEDRLYQKWLDKN